ncbi:MAG TPA: N-acetylneuraminate synthase family protein, partial [bacterium]|nr:N-acetylneuraminate synthase family protein [bacterium]
RTLHELYREAHTPWEWQPRLKAIADGLGIALFSTAFDPTAVEFLERMGVPAHKVASLEITDLPLIRLMGATRKPLIISTGMATLDEIAEAVDAARGAGAREIALLRCASAYPARPEDMRLASIPDLAARTSLPVGISDHTLGIEVPIAAVALGACIVEKHFTLSRAAGGPDALFSAEPEEFRRMARAVRTVEKARGTPCYGPGPHERESLRFRRSLYVVEDTAAGETFTERNVRSIRPAGGLSPKHLSEVLGKRAARAAARGTPLSWDLVAR